MCLQGDEVNERPARKLSATTVGIREINIFCILGDGVPKSNERSQRRLRSRLDRARERRRLLSSIVGLGFWRWSRGSNDVWLSKQARRILGLAVSAAVTRDRLIATIHPLDRAEAVRSISVAATHSDTVEVDLRVIGAGDQISWITARAYVYRDLD